MKHVSNPSANVKSFDATWRAFLALTGAESDFTIASRYADYRLADWPVDRDYHFHILLKTRDQQPPPSLPINRQRKRAFGWKTADREEMRDWIIQAMLLGFVVFSDISHAGSDIADIRRQIKDVRP